MSEKKFEPVVTVSATYGVGGSVIAPRLATALGIPFIDRMISADLSSPDPSPMRSQERISEGEQAATPTGRFLSYFARAASVGAMMPPDPVLEDDDQIRAKSEAPLRPLAAGAPGVILGRAAAVVLRTRPRAFHVRLDGDVTRRTRWGAAHEQLSEDSAARHQAETDKARTLFVKRLYRTDPAVASLYHIVLDPTAIGIDPALDVLLTAARAFFEANP